MRIGFVPLVDASPLIGAFAWGEFTKEGLDVSLTCEIGWGTIREKLIFGELDAVQIPAPMAVAIRLGIGCAPTPVVTHWILNWQGNAITLSRNISDQGVSDGVSLHHLIRSRSPGRLTLAVVARHSTHAFLLHKWLRSSGIIPERDVRLVVLPPPQMVRSLSEGLIDGFCSGEPWNSAAVRAGCGWIAAASADIAPGHVEKVLLVRESFANSRVGEYGALLRAMKSSAARCESADGRDELVSLLAGREWLHLDPAILHSSLVGPLDRGDGVPRTCDRFHKFFAPLENAPSLHTASEILSVMRDDRQIPDPIDRLSSLESTVASVFGGTNSPSQPLNPTHNRRATTTTSV